MNSSYDFAEFRFGKIIKDSGGAEHLYVRWTESGKKNRAKLSFRFNPKRIEVFDSRIPGIAWNKVIETAWRIRADSRSRQQSLV